MCLVFFCPSGNILPGNLPGTSGGNIAAHRGRQKIASAPRTAKNRQRTADGKKSPAQCGRQKSRQRNAGGKKVDSAPRAAKKSTAQRGQNVPRSRRPISPFRSPPHFSFSQPDIFFSIIFAVIAAAETCSKMPGSGQTISRKNGDGNNFQGDGNYYHLPLNSCFSFVYFRETGFSRISERAEANPAKKQKCPIFIILHDHNFFGDDNSFLRDDKTY